MKSTKTFGVRFILRYATSKSSEALIYARVTYNKKRVEIYANRSIHPDKWDAQRQVAVGSKELVNRINPHLDEVRLKLIDCYQQLKMQTAFITAEGIKRLYVGEDLPQNTLFSLIEYHSNSSQTILKKGTFKNYGATEKYLKLFLKHQYRTDDMLLTELNYQFITQFEFFLRTTKSLQANNPLGNNGVMKHMERLRKIVTMGFKLDWIVKDPFIQYKLKFQRTEREFLIESEIETLHNVVLPSKLERCRDLFLFSCYTGLSYVDLVNLCTDNIALGIDGELWLRTSRQKTETKVNVPLLPQAMEILNKYKGDSELIAKNRVLPYLCNQKVNEYLKQIATICNINKPITFHVARHTFATTVTLNNGIPIETVSKMLGHNKLSTTQIYVHVLDKKISDDMKKLRNKFRQNLGAKQIAV